jgi:chaperonin GroEL (HSP60 family)
MQKLTHVTTQIVRDDILAHNVRAVTEITNVLATSLGPQSMSKMLVDPFGGIIITNDGSRILQEMQIIHPAAKLLVQMAIKQDSNVGDGTTSVVLVCGELLRQCQAYLQKKSVHRNVLSLKLQQTCKRACKMMDTLCENETDRKESLQRLVTTSLATKYISKYNENGILSKLVIQTITYIYNFAERNCINVEKDLKVVKLSHPNVQQSLVLRGGCVIRVRNVNVLPVESKLEKVNVSICTVDIGPFLFVKDTVIRDPKQFHELEELVMKSYWTQIVQPLMNRNVKVLISSRSVDRRCISLLNDNNIFVFELEDANVLDSNSGIDNDIEFLKQCCKVENTIVNVKDFQDQVGTVESIQWFEKGSRLHIHNHNSCHLATLVLRAPTQEILKELDM